MRGTKAKFLRKVASFLYEQSNREDKSHRKIYKALKKDYKKGKK
jgi:hypothetical protein